MNITHKSQMKSTVRQIYRENLRKNLEHRLEVARNKGDQTLITQLEKEASYLNLE